MSVISIEIKGELKAQIETEAKAQEINTDKLVEKILSDFFYLQKMNKIRKKLEPHFNSLGINSEQDIFDEVS